MQHLKHGLLEPINLIYIILYICMYRYTSKTNHITCTKMKNCIRHGRYKGASRVNTLSCLTCLPPSVMLTVTRNKMQIILLIYIYNSVFTCRQHIINSSASAPPNATKIAVKKFSDVDVCMFRPELQFSMYTCCFLVCFCARQRARWLRAELT